MNDQQPKSKNKKLLTYYLILGACILIIAAVAIAVTLSLTLGKDDMTTGLANLEKAKQLGNAQAQSFIDKYTKQQ